MQSIWSLHQTIRQLQEQLQAIKENGECERRRRFEMSSKGSNWNTTIRSLLSSFYGQQISRYCLRVYHSFNLESITNNQV